MNAVYEATESAIAQVDDAMDPEWREKAKAGIQLVALSKRYFTTDDFWD